MNRDIKTITKIIITVLMTITILLILPKTVKAYDYLIDDTSYDWNSIEGRKTFYVGGDSNLSRSDVFCIERGQGIYGATIQATYKYDIANDLVTRTNLVKNTNKTTTDTKTIRFAKGLAYITSKRSGGYDTEAQEAMWAYLRTNKYDSTYANAISFFGIKDQYYDVYYAGNGNVYNAATGVGHSIAGQWYNTAMAIRNGTSSCDVTATSYKLQGESGPQEILFVKSAKIEEIPEVKLNFKKMNLAGTTNLTGATIDFEKGSNVNSISTTSLIIGTGSIKVKPKENTGTFSLKVTESQAPGEYYKMQGTAELTVKYDKNNGKVLSVKSTNTTNIPDVTGSTITIGNMPKPNAIELLKKDFHNHEVSGVKFLVYFNGVKSLKIGGCTIKLDSFKEVAFKVSKNKNIPLTEDGNKLVCFRSDGIHLRKRWKEDRLW